MMSFRKIIRFQHFGTFQISVSYPCSYWYCSSSSDSESNSESEKQSRLYLEFNLSISASHCCFVLLRLKVLGLLAWGFGISGDGLCCCLPSSSSFFCDLQKGQSRPHPHFSGVLSVLLLFSNQIVFWK